MGANFAARRRLFDAIGGFDEILGGGGPLRSSQDYDLAYRTYRAGRVILLRPEVTLRHDGRREAEDWPALLLNYGIGDGAFYTKHVRCRDPYALLLLTRRLGRTGSSHLVKRAQRRHGAGWELRPRDARRHPRELQVRRRPRHQVVRGPLTGTRRKEQTHA